MVMKRILVGGGVLAIAGLVVAAWLLGLFTAEPDEVSITETIAEVQSAPAEPEPPAAQPDAGESDGAEPDAGESDGAAPAATPAVVAADAPEGDATGAPAAPESANSAAEGDFLSGAWSVQADDLTFVGYRADSQTGEAVGRSRGVTGTLDATANTVETVDIVVDMTIMSSDSRLRDDHLGDDGFEYRTYPTSSFSLTEPINVPAIPDQGVEVAFTATGELTVREITQPVTLDLQAAIVDERLIIVGSTTISTEDFGASISNITEAIMEFSLIFARS